MLLDPSRFDDLDDASKVGFVLNEHAGLKESLDKALARLAGSSSTVDDPDGFASMTFDDEGRMVTLSIADAAVTELSYLALERRLNAMIEAGTDEVAQIRNELHADFLAEWGDGT